jgi:hypothetical protein
VDDGATALFIADDEADDEADVDEDMPLALLALAWFEPAPGAAAAILGLRADSCRWPSGDPSTPEFSFCGAPLAIGRYCERHFLQATLPRSAMRPLTI